MINDIDVCDFIKDNKNLQDYFKYNCPVCFRYFNTILKADCCENYLCHYCVREIIISKFFLNKKKNKLKIKMMSRLSVAIANMRVLHTWIYRKKMVLNFILILRNFRFMRKKKTYNIVMRSST